MVFFFFGSKNLCSGEDREDQSYGRSWASKFAEQLWSLVFYVYTNPTERNGRPLRAKEPTVRVEVSHRYTDCLCSSASSLYWYHQNTLYFLHVGEVKEQSAVFICCWHKITYFPTCLLSKGTLGEMMAFQPACQKPHHQSVFYQINSMVRLRTKYKCDWSVILG